LNYEHNTFDFSIKNKFGGPTELYLFLIYIVINGIIFKRHDEALTSYLWVWYKPICHMVAIAIKELRDS